MLVESLMNVKLPTVGEIVIPVQHLFL